MKIIGHRGAKGLAPENTLAAFRKALEHGVDEIEFDVRITKDGVPVLLHDHAASDPAGEKLVVSSSTYSELKEHKPDLATLEEAIDFVNGEVPLLIEVKPHEPAAPIIRVLKKYLEDGWTSDRFLLGSFSQRTLRELHAALPEVEMVVIEAWSGVRARWRANQVHTKRISIWHSTLYGWYIRMAQKSGYKMAVYTLNDTKKAHAWADDGLYAVITDFPDRFEH